MSDVSQVAQAAESLPLIKFIAAFVLVIGGMLALAWGLKRAGLAGHILRTGPHRRLRVVESMPVDHRRRLVLLRRDDREHLILLGPDHATVVERDIAAPNVLSAVPEEGSTRASA